jgi:histidinol-phosphate aminotransferase
MRPRVTPGIEALSPYEAGKPLEELARELGIEDAIKLASNENPLGPSPLALEAARRAIGEVHRYPDASAYRLRERLAALHRVAMDEVIHGNGSNELIELAIRTFTTPAQHIVFGEPAFVMYRIAAMAHGVRFSAVPLANLTHDLEAMAAAVEADTRLLFIANPNNPTGTHVSRAAIERLLRSLPEQVIVVMDEAYFEYADAPDYPNSLELRGLHEQLLVLRTFSKIHGLAAMRVGYGIAPAPIVDYMNRVRAPFNVGSIGQAAALAALDDTAHVEQSQRTNREQRVLLAAGLERLGLVPAPSQANFVYVECGRPARPIYEQLLRKGVIVRPFGGLPAALRITVGTPAENERLLSALGTVLA